MIACRVRARALCAIAGDHRESLADCDRVMRRNPSQFGALSGGGQIYFCLAQCERAIECWRCALEVNSKLTGVEINFKSAGDLFRRKRARTA